MTLRSPITTFLGRWAAAQRARDPDGPRSVQGADHT